MGRGGSRFSTVDCADGAGANQLIARQNYANDRSFSAFHARNDVDVAVIRSPTDWATTLPIEIEKPPQVETFTGRDRPCLLSSRAARLSLPDQKARLPAH